MRFIQGDIFEVPLKRRYYELVYADPPYANCRFKYARGNNSRQWGRDSRADFMRDLISRMEYLRSPDGVCAVSMAATEWRLAPLFPSKSRLFFWTKPYAPHRPGVWPTFATELVAAWGRFPNRDEQKKAAKTPFDWLNLSPAVPKGGKEHENPKPVEFGDWLLDVTIGPRPACVLELFAGTAPICRAAESRGLDATGVDLKQWFDQRLHDVMEPAA